MTILDDLHLAPGIKLAHNVPAESAGNSQISVVDTLGDNQAMLGIIGNQA
jgi:hypothetical protein